MPLSVPPIGPGLVGGLWVAASVVGIIALSVAVRYAGRLKMDEARIGRWEARFFLGSVAALAVLFLATLAWLPWNSASPPMSTIAWGSTTAIGCCSRSR